MWPHMGPIPTYGILYFLGIALHFPIARWLARRWGLNRRAWLATSLCYLLGMILGAKILYDLRQGQLALPALLNLQHWTQGGLWGGLLAYFILAIPAVLLLAKPRRTALDLVAVTVPIPYIMAKLGCFLNGCCYGKPCLLPWAVTFPEAARGAPAGVAIHPTQLYEVLLMLVLLGLFTALHSERNRGTKLLWFLLLFGLGRTAIDFVRGEPSPAFLGPLTLTQLLCVIGAALAGILLALAHRKTNARRKSDLACPTD